MATKSSGSPAAAARARNTAAAAASGNKVAIATAAKANASAVARSGQGNAALTPTQQYAAMTPSQQASFSKNNPTVDTGNIGPALNIQNQQGKFESVQGTGSYQSASISSPTEAGVNGEGPGPTGIIPSSDTGGTDGASGSGGGQDKAPEIMGQHQQNVGGMIAGVSASGDQTKQQVLDKAVASGQATVDKTGNVISSSGKNLGNIQGINMSESAIGNTIPNANDPLQQQANQNQQTQQQQQGQVNNIHPGADLGLTNSPDSPFWNNFGQPAIDNENILPGYMNERNKIIASGVMLNNSGMKFMGDAKRKEIIINDILDRQGEAIDPTMKDRYKKTVDNINNLITREIPQYTPNDFFKMLLTGEQIDYTASTGNPAFKSAKIRFNDLNTYSSMDASSISDAIADGKLNKGGQTWNDLINKGMGTTLDKAYSMYNIKVESKITDYIGNEIGSFNTDTSLQGQKSNILDLGTGLESQISMKILQLMTSDKIPTLASFLAADPEVQAAKTASRETETEINNLSDEITNFSDDIKAKVVEKGGEATDDPFLSAYIQEKQKPFVRKLSVLNSKYRNEIAMLDDLSANAKTEFEIKEYNKTSEINGYQFILSRLDAQEAKKTAATAAAQAQSNRQKTFDQNANKSNQPNMQITGYDSNGKPVYQYFDVATNSWKSAPTQSASGSNTPTGQLVDVNFGGKTFKADSGMASALSNVEQQLNAAGINRDTGAANYRTKEQQQKLYDAYIAGTGGKAAAPGSSNHEKGLGIDMYTNNGKSSALGAPSQEMIAIMEANGFKRANIKGDAGHFDYVGGNKQTGSADIASLSDEAQAIVTGYASIKDQTITGGKRLKLASEIGNFFDANKDKFDDEGEFYMRKSAIYNSFPGPASTAKLESISNVGFQLDGLEQQFNNADTGPLRELREKGTDKRTNQDYIVVRQQMEAILPDLARGVFGEKGVLTDTDIERYRKTIPNVGNKEAVNAAIVDNLRQILSNTFLSAVVTEAKNGNNMQNWVDSYIRARDMNTPQEQDTQGIPTGPVISNPNSRLMK